MASLVAGVMVWRRLQQTNSAEAVVALERLTHQFASSPSFSGIPFEGESSRVSFPSLVSAPLSGESASWTLGRIEYFFDTQTKAFCVREQTYGAAKAGSASSKPRCLLAGVKQLQLEYLRLDRPSGTSTWNSQWNPQEMGRFPWAIRATVVMEGVGDQEVSYTKSAVRPVQ